MSRRGAHAARHAADGQPGVSQLADANRAAQRNGQASPGESWSSQADELRAVVAAQSQAAGSGAHALDQGAAPLAGAGAAGSAPATAPKRRVGGVIFTVVIVVLFLIGAAFALYPVYSNLYNQYCNARIAVEYQQTVDGADAEAIAKALAEAHAYNESHPVNTIVDPFGDVHIPSDDVYNGLLNIRGDGMMGYLDIPKIDQRLAVYHGISAEVLDKGVGHLQGTSLPVGGKSTHCVLSGHRGLASAKLFTDLDQLQKGDYFILHVLGEDLAYSVDKISVVKPEQSEGLAVQPGKDLVTLVTCTPYGVNTHRMLVRGHRVDYINQAEADGPAMWLANFSPETLALACVMSLVVVIAFVAFIRRFVRKDDASNAGKANR